MNQSRWTGQLALMLGCAVVAFSSPSMLSGQVVLTVNADTRAVSLSNPSGPAAAIDGYSILSTKGLLNVAQWSSLQDQARPGWHEAAPRPVVLSELNSTVGGSLSVGGAPIGLGMPYTPPTTFGDAPDLRFEYTTPTGQIVSGLVDYTGNAAENNLLLTVDPTNGQGRLSNSSTTVLQLDGYSILSASGSLLANNGDWNSLDDQNIGSWVEATPRAGALSELSPVGASTLSSGQSFNLGGLFNEATGTRDLVLEYSLVGEATPRTGVVRYESAAPIGLAGDYNGNGVVDAADFVAWRNNPAAFGGDPAGYNTWRANFGRTAGNGALVAAASVPEPAVGTLVLSAFVCATGALRRRR
jgi:hypothetical protein